PRPPHPVARTPPRHRPFPPLANGVPAGPDSPPTPFPGRHPLTLASREAILEAESVQEVSKYRREGCRGVSGAGSHTGLPSFRRTDTVGHCPPSGPTGRGGLWRARRQPGPHPADPVVPHAHLGRERPDPSAEGRALPVLQPGPGDRRAFGSGCLAEGLRPRRLSRPPGASDGWRGGIILRERSFGIDINRTKTRRDR